MTPHPGRPGASAATSVSRAVSIGDRQRTPLRVTTTVLEPSTLYYCNCQCVFSLSVPDIKRHHRIAALGQGETEQATTGDKAMYHAWHVSSTPMSLQECALVYRQCCSRGACAYMVIPVVVHAFATGNGKRLRTFMTALNGLCTRTAESASQGWLCPGTMSVRIRRPRPGAFGVGLPAVLPVLQDPCYDVKIPIL